jgi:uncharacterized protein YkwD
MGKGVTWLALSAAILVTLVLVSPARASLVVEGPVARLAADGPPAGGLTAAGSGAASAVQTSDAILGSVTLTTPERTVLGLINNARAARGLHRLALRTSLCRAARAHSLSMLRLSYFSHSSASGETFAQRILRYGYARTGCSYWGVGEVIGWGAGSTAGSARAIFRAWMGSTAHRTVIFTRRWRDIGIGRALGSYAGIADVRMLTVDFGRRIY